MTPRLLALQLDSSPGASYPATADDIFLILEFLAAPPADRLDQAQHLRARLDRQQRMHPSSRPPIPCHRPDGLYLLLPARLAAWLAHALASTDETVRELRAQLSDWLFRRPARASKTSLVAQRRPLG